MKTHPLSVTHLVVGLVFLGVAGSWALREADVIGTADVTWLIPVSLIIAGGVGLVAAMAKGVSGRRSDSTDGAGTSSYDDGYRSTYDAPLPPQDYTTDLDRRLDEAGAKTANDTDTDTDDTTVIDNREGDAR